MTNLPHSSHCFIDVLSSYSNMLGTRVERNRGKGNGEMVIERMNPLFTMKKSLYENTQEMMH